MWKDLNTFETKLASAIADLEARLCELRTAPHASDSTENATRLENILACFQETLANPPSWLL